MFRFYYNIVLKTFIQTDFLRLYFFIITGIYANQNSFNFVIYYFIKIKSTNGFRTRRNQRRQKNLYNGVQLAYS
jgi:hypothetical protein